MNLERIIIGCDQLGGSDWGETKITEIMDALLYAYKNGFKKFDTADVYGLGLSEARLSTLFYKYNDLKITTKVGVRWLNGSNWERAKTFHDDSSNYLKTSFENSIKRLEGLNIETLLLHWPTSVENLEKAIETFELFKKQGKINNYGFCNGLDLLPVIKNKIDNNQLIYQTKYNLISQNDEYIINQTKEFKQVQLYGVYAQGVLAWDNLKNNLLDKNDRRSRLSIYKKENICKLKNLKIHLNKISSKYKISNSSLILYCTLRSIPNANIIVGVRNKNHIKSIIKSCNLNISQSDYDFIKNLFKNLNLSS